MEKEKLRLSHLMVPILMFMGISVSIAFFIIIKYAPLTYFLVVQGICLLLFFGGYLSFRKLKYPDHFWEKRKPGVMKKLSDKTFIVLMITFFIVLVITAITAVLNPPNDLDILDIILKGTGILNVLFISFWLFLLRMDIQEILDPSKKKPLRMMSKKEIDKENNITDQKKKN